MEIEGKFVQRAAGLRAIPYIQRPERLLELDLSQNLLILQLNAFQSFTRLRKLTLSATGLSTFPPLPASLERVELADNQIMRVPAGLKPCISLNYLDISRNLISDLTPLARFPDLAVLQAADNKIALITGLEKLRKLSILGLDNNRVKDTGQIAALPHTLQFLSLRNTPVVRFLMGDAKLPGSFVALQDGQLIGEKYEKIGGKAGENRKTQKASVGFIDLGKAKPATATQSRAATPDIPRITPNETQNQVQEMVEELDLLKRQNGLLEEKICSLEGVIEGGDREEMLSDLTSALEIDVNEFSFSHNKFGQIVAVLQDRERERKELRAQNALLLRRLQAIEEQRDISETNGMRISDLESENVRLSGFVSDLRQENEGLKGKTANQELKLQKIRAKSRDLLHLHNQEAAKSANLQDQLAKLYADYSKLLKAGLYSALEAHSAPPVPQSKPEPAQEAVLSRLEERMAKLQSKVKRLSGRPEEYYKKLKQCHLVIDSQNKCE
jgi:hypothetical protein